MPLLSVTRLYEVGSEFVLKPLKLPNIWYGLKLNLSNEKGAGSCPLSTFSNILTVGSSADTISSFSSNR